MKLKEILDDFGNYCASYGQDGIGENRTIERIKEWALGKVPKKLDDYPDEYAEGYNQATFRTRENIKEE